MLESDELEKLAQIRREIRKNKDFIALGLAVLTFGLSLLSLGISVFTWYRESTFEQRRFKVEQEAADKRFQIEHASWIDIYDTELTAATADKPAMFKAKLRNQGVAEDTNINVNAWYALEPASADVPKGNADQNAVLNKTTRGTSDEVDISWQKLESFEKTKEYHPVAITADKFPQWVGDGNIGILQDGTSRLVFRIVVGYIDQFKTLHHTNGCYLYSYKEKVSHTCRTRNDKD